MWNRRSDTPAEIEKKLTRDPDLFLVAEHDNKIIGTVIGGFDGRRGLLYHLAVDGSFRGQGIGTLLLSEVESRLRLKGCRRRGDAGSARGTGRAQGFFRDVLRQWLLQEVADLPVRCQQAFDPAAQFRILAASLVEVSGALRRVGVLQGGEEDRFRKR